MNLKLWAELHGETNEDELTHCYECNHELYHGDCINPNCQNQTRGYCSECGELVDSDDLTSINKKDSLCKKCYKDFIEWQAEESKA